MARLAYSREHRFGEAAKVGGMLEVEIGCRAALAEVACERGLTALARAEQRDDRARLQAVAETFQLDGTFDHSCILSV